MCAIIQFSRLVVIALWVCIGFPYSSLKAADAQTENAGDAKPPVIRITNGEWAPFLSEKLPGYGFGSELVEASFAAVGIQVEWGFFPWGRAYSLAKHGQWDAAAIWKRMPAREKDFLFSDPIFHQSETLVCHKDKLVSWDDPANLTGFALGVPVFGQYKYIDELIEAGKIEAVKYPTYKSMYLGVLSGRVDCVIINPHVHAKTMLEHFDKAARNTFALAEKPLYSVTQHLMISRNIENGPYFVKRFNEGLKMIQKNGRYHAIIVAAGGDQYIERVAPTTEPKR